MPRYTVAGCCSNTGHCSNRRYQDFEQQQYLDIVKKNLKDYLFYDGYRNIRVLDPCMDLRSLGRLEHPTPLAYSKIAAATTKINDRMLSQEQDSKRRRESFGDSGQSLPGARHGRMDLDPGASPRLHRGNRRGRGRSGGQWAGANLY
jgi:hypothetical protein